MNRRVLSMLLATGLVLSLFVSAMSVSAFHDVSEPEDWGECPNAPELFEDGSESQAHAYFPWVANDADDLDGLGPFTGAVTVQSLTQFPEDGAITVDFYVGTGDGWDLGESVDLTPNESITLSADQLDIAEGEGAPVVAIAWDEEPEITYDDDDEVESCEPGSFGRIAGVVKNVSPNGGSAETTADDMTVDGYSALVGNQVAQDLIDEDNVGTYILPIAQNNSGWNTMLRIANMSDDGGLTNVTATFYGSGQQGYAGQSEVVNLQLRPGEVASVDVSDVVPDEWVGSVFITSSADVGAVAERYKASDDMLITNTSRPEEDGSEEHFGALVFRNYNYWNTGISIANLDDDETNSVTVYYVGPTNNIVGQDTVTIPPRGMEFIYTPGTQDLGLFDGFVGSVIIDGQHELIAAIDQVKYVGNDPDVGQAMSYVTEEAENGASEGEALAMPLVQKGNPNTGNGDTSGIQLFNASDEDSVSAQVVFYGANGIAVAPTVENNNPDPIEITVPAHGNYTLYTHGQSELSSGFLGSTIVYVDDGDGELVGVSNNVNYEVDGDGSVAFNMILDPFFPGFDELNGIPLSN